MLGSKDIPEWVFAEGLATGEFVWPLELEGSSFDPSRRAPVYVCTYVDVGQSADSYLVDIKW